MIFFVQLKYVNYNSFYLQCIFLIKKKQIPVYWHMETEKHQIVKILVPDTPPLLKAYRKEFNLDLNLYLSQM